MQPKTMLITAIGVLASVIASGAGILWGLAHWAKGHVVEPLVKSHVELIDALKEQLPEQTKKLENAEKLLVSQNQILKRVETALAKQP